LLTLRVGSGHHVTSHDALPFVTSRSVEQQATYGILMSVFQLYVVLSLLMSSCQCHSDECHLANVILMNVTLPINSDECHLANIILHSVILPMSFW
jgi:hypothetical protein